ncbi:MAG: DUF1697 domain-containing protein [Leptospirales bacterium]|nr:DUF1697 domain-containing protein [Leptospirales bacterium]
MAHPRKYDDSDPLIQRLRQICLELPETYEKEGWGECTFRVNKGTMFAMTDCNHHGSGHTAVWVKANPVIQDMMVKSDPKRFFIPPYMGPQGWIGVRLQLKSNWKEVASMIRDGYEMSQPRKSKASAGKSKPGPAMPVPGKTNAEGKPAPDKHSPGKKECYVILLRGVMPTGKNVVPMARLREVLTKAGLGNVQTYIQSGNVIAESSLSRSEIQDLIHTEIHKSFGADIAVVARTAKEFAKILPAHPFGKAPTEKLYFTILQSQSQPTLLKEFAAGDYSPDDIRLRKDVIYTLCATKYSDVKVNNNVIERRLKVSATTRNYNTMAKLMELSNPRTIQNTASRAKKKSPQTPGKKKSQTRRGRLA